MSTHALPSISIPLIATLLCSGVGTVGCKKVKPPSDSPRDDTDTVPIDPDTGAGGSDFATDDSNTDQDDTDAPMGDSDTPTLDSDTPTLDPDTAAVDSDKGDSSGTADDSDVAQDTGTEAASGSGETDASDDSESEPEPLSGCDGLEGQYEITFPQSSASPVTVTLALTHEADDRCTARITPQWMPSFMADAQVLEDQVVIGQPCDLLDTAPVGCGFDCRAVAMTERYYGIESYEGIYWTQLILRRTDTGGLTGAVASLGARHMIYTDAYACDVLSDTGSLENDATGPALKAGPREMRLSNFEDNRVGPFEEQGSFLRYGLPVDALFPWDVLEVKLSEPTGGQGPSIAVRDAATGEESAIELEQASQDDWDTPFDTWLWGRFTDWDAVTGTEQTVSVAEPFADPAGNPATQSSVTVLVLDVGAAVTEHIFSDTMAGAPYCIHGCTPADSYWTLDFECGELHAGVAGRLASNGLASAIEITVRKQDRLIIRLFGSSGRVYDTVYVWDHTDDWTTITLPIDAEPHVGYIITTSAMCHPTPSTSTFDIASVRLVFP